MIGLKMMSSKKIIMQSQDIKPREPQDEHIVENKELSIWEALIPVIALVLMLFFNVLKFLVFMLLFLVRKEV